MFEAADFKVLILVGVPLPGDVEGSREALWKQNFSNITVN